MASIKDISSNGYTKTEEIEQTSPLRSQHSEERLHMSLRTMGDVQEEYSVERLLDEKPGKSGSLIEVEWKGWAAEDNTWELRSQLLEDVPDMVAEFDSRPRPDFSASSPKVSFKTEDPDVKMSAQTSTVGDISTANSESTPDQQPPAPSPDWTGWAELENDPLIFSTLLREWGVRGVSVREVIPLDSIFDTPVTSTLGLIFLSRYIVFDQGTSLPSAPISTLWFANQISAFSCATVALMNIINNQSSLSLGPSLQSFKSLTANLSPKDRGLALDSLDPVRSVHNSFATFNDKLHVDARLRDDVKTHTTKTRAQTRWKGRAKGKGGKSRKKPKSSTSTPDDESGLHFVAFVPAQDNLWRLDGLERSPTSIGRIADAENWLMMVVPVLEAQFNAAAMNELEFSLLSVVLTDPEVEDEKDCERMRKVREDWGPLMATLVGIHAEKGDVKAKLG